MEVFTSFSGGRWHKHPNTCSPQIPLIPLIEVILDIYGPLASEGSARNKDVVTWSSHSLYLLVNQEFANLNMAQSKSLVSFLSSFPMNSMVDSSIWKRLYTRGESIRGRSRLPLPRRWLFLPSAKVQEVALPGFPWETVVGIPEESHEKVFPKVLKVVDLTVIMQL